MRMINSNFSVSIFCTIYADVDHHQYLYINLVLLYLRQAYQCLAIRPGKKRSSFLLSTPTTFPKCLADTAADIDRFQKEIMIETLLVR